MLTFPLSLGAFFDTLDLVTSRFYLGSGKVVTRTRGGDQLSAEIAARLWIGRVDLSDAYHKDADAVAARLELLEGANASFYASPPQRRFPIADPEGLFLGDSMPTIHSISASTQELRISNLPPNYFVSIGDMVSFAYGANPVRYALHRVVTSGRADEDGVTPLLQVNPPIREGATVGTYVQLKNPFCKVVVTSVDHPSASSLFSTGIGFDFAQTLR